MTKLDGRKPITGYKASAEDLMALCANPDRHPNALGYELTRATETVLETLSSLHAGLTVAQNDLSLAACSELIRRQRAKARLVADCPALRGLVA